MEVQTTKHESLKVARENGLKDNQKHTLLFDLSHLVFLYESRIEPVEVSSFRSNLIEWAQLNQECIDWLWDESLKPYELRKKDRDYTVGD